MSNLIFCESIDDKFLEIVSSIVKDRTVIDCGATHVFSAYVNYYLNNYKVSHTTQDVITEFEKELNSYYKKGLLSQFVSHDIK